MNIYDIKNKANEVLRQPNQLFKVILYVGIIQALFSALSGLFDGILGSIISLILSILTVTLGHGIIVASLKVVNNNGNLVDEKEDSLVGIKRFGQLFPTYFLYRVVVALAGIVVGVIGMLLMYTMITDAQFSNLSQLVLMYVNKSTISQDEIVNIVASLSNVFSFVFILVIIISILSVYLSLKFGLFNYILQKYNYKEESLSLIYIIAKLLLGTDVEDYINTKELLSKIDCVNVEYEYTSVMEILSLIKSFLSRVYYPSVSNIRDLDDYKKVLTHIKSKRQDKVG